MTAIVMQSLPEMPDTASLTCSNGIGTLCCHNFSFRRRRQRQRVKKVPFLPFSRYTKPNTIRLEPFLFRPSRFQTRSPSLILFSPLRLSPLSPSIPINNGRSHLSLEFLSLSPALFFGWLKGCFISNPFLTPSLPRLPIENDPQKFKI